MSTSDESKVLCRSSSSGRAREQGNRKTLKLGGHSSLSWSPCHTNCVCWLFFLQSTTGRLEKKGISKLDAKLDVFDPLSLFFSNQETVFIPSLSKRVEKRKHSKKEEEFFVTSSRKVAYVAQDKAGK